MGSFEARKTQCLEASHLPWPFGTRRPTPAVAPACDIDRLEHSSGRVRRLKALLPSGLESSYPPRRTYSKRSISLGRALVRVDQFRHFARIGALHGSPI